MKQEHKQTKSLSSQQVDQQPFAQVPTRYFLTTSTAQDRSQSRTKSPLFLHALHLLCKRTMMQFMWLSQFSCGLQHLPAAYLLSFSGLSSQFFFNSLEAHKDSMGFIEEFSQDLRVNIYILSDDIDKGAAWHSL